MLRGIFSVIMASVLFGLIPSGNKYVLLSGMREDCLLFYQASIMFFATALGVTAKRISIKMPLSDILKLLALGAVGIGATDYLLNLSYGYLPVSTVVLLHFMYPTIVLLIMVIIFRQRPSLLTICAVIASLLGLLLVTDLRGSINIAGAVFALGSAATYALFAVANDRGGINRFPLIVKLFYMTLSTMFIYGIRTVAADHFSPPADGKTMLVLVGGVGVGSLFAFYLIAYGIKRVGASRAAFLNMLEPGFGVVAGVLIYNEVLSAREGLGCLCILLSVLFIAFDGFIALQRYKHK